MSDAPPSYTESMLPLDLPFAVLSVSLRATQTVHLPAFPGSKLEGAFGRALYRLACTQPQRETCAGCPLQAICPYGLTYAPRLPEGLSVSSLGTPPRPIMFRVAYTQERTLAADEVLTFGLVVVGRALTQLPYLLAALRDVGQDGLGVTRGRLHLEEVQSLQPYTGEAVTLLRGEHLDVQLSPIVLNQAQLPAIQGGFLRLRLHSPLRLKVEGQLVTQPHFPILIRALQRRISNLEQVHGAQTSLGANFTALPLLAREIQTTGFDVRPVSQLRKGPRPHQKTEITGLLGTLDYQGDFAPFSTLLRYGEQLGVGKWAHFGAGRYDLEASA